jgi:hypothetical protein
MKNFMPEQPKNLNFGKKFGFKENLCNVSTTVILS